jgi:hypothetical protein
METNKKKLALVIHNLQGGGMERVMSMLLQNFAARKESVELHLILYGITREVFYDIPSSVILYIPNVNFNNS